MEGDKIKMKTKWHKINGISFMKEMILNGVEPDEQKSVLTVESRPDVASRRWWTLEWTGADGRKQSVSASTADLVFEKAAEREMQIRAGQGMNF